MSNRTTLIKAYISRDPDPGCYYICVGEPTKNFVSDEWEGGKGFLVTPGDMHSILPEDDRLEEGEGPVSLIIVLNLQDGMYLNEVLKQSEAAHKVKSALELALAKLENASYHYDHVGDLSSIREALASLEAKP